MLTKRDLLRSAALAAMTATTAKSIPALAQTTADRPGFLKAKGIAEAGFIYGLPIVMNYAVMYEYAVDRNSGQFKAPFNQIKNEPNVFTYKDTAIVTPNSDTPYSFVWMDLRAEPIVLSVPAVDTKRYYSVQLCDGNTYNYGYIGTRTTGSGEGDYMVVGPDWKGMTPPGIKKVFRSSTQLSLAGYRTQLFSPDDLDNVKKVQAGYKVQALSAYLKQPATVAARAIDFPKIDKELVKTNFFEYLDFALQFAPAQENEKEIRAQLARIGVGPGKTMNFKDLSIEDKLEIGLGMKEGDRKVDEAVANAGKAVNGWRVSWPAGRQRSLQWRLVEARCRREGGHLWQQSGGGDVSTHPHRRRRPDARWQQKQLHADVPTRSAAARKRFLVVDHVRRQNAAPDREPDQSLFDQLADAAQHEDKSGRFADAVHPEQIAGRRQGCQLAACSRRHDLSGHAALLAEDRSTFDLAGGRRDMAAARHKAGCIERKGARR